MRRFNRNLYKSERREREKVYFEEIMEMIKKKYMNPEIQKIQRVPTEQIKGDLHLNPLW